MERVLIERRRPWPCRRRWYLRIVGPNYTLEAWTRSEDEARAFLDGWKSTKIDWRDVK